MRSLEVRFLAFALLLSASPVGAAQQPQSFAVRAGTVITISGEDHSPGVVIVRDGVIQAVGGAELPVPDDMATQAERILCAQPDLEQFARVEPKVVVIEKSMRWEMGKVSVLPMSATVYKLVVKR